MGLRGIRAPSQGCPNRRREQLRGRFHNGASASPRFGDRCPSDHGSGCRAGGDRSLRLPSTTHDARDNARRGFRVLRCHQGQASPTFPAHTMWNSSVSMRPACRMSRTPIPDDDWIAKRQTTTTARRTYNILFVVVFGVCFLFFFVCYVLVEETFRKLIFLGTTADESSISGAPPSRINAGRRPQNFQK